MAKSLKQIALDAGLEGGEEALKLAVPDLIDLFAENAIKSENKIDDFIAPFLVQFKPQLMLLLEKVNPND